MIWRRDLIIFSEVHRVISLAFLYFWVTFKSNINIFPNSWSKNIYQLNARNLLNFLHLNMIEIAHLYRHGLFLHVQNTAMKLVAKMQAPPWQNLVNLLKFSFCLCNGFTLLVILKVCMESIIELNYFEIGHRKDSPLSYKHVIFLNTFVFRKTATFLFVKHFICQSSIKGAYFCVLVDYAGLDLSTERKWVIQIAAY